MEGYRMERVQNGRVQNGRVQNGKDIEWNKTGRKDKTKREVDKGRVWAGV